MITPSHRIRVSVSVLALSLGLSGLFTHYASAQPDERVIDNIIVTAQKREESLQDVPISITAFNAEDLEVRDIKGFEDISQFTPGFNTYTAPANTNGVQLFMRGIGTGDPQHGLDTKTALYVDGMYLGKVIGLAFNSPDIERVEVLKGPQGTLYGRNAVAGAINIISAKPVTDQYFGEVEIGYGTYTQTGSGFVNFPLSDTQAIRLSVSYEDDEGWVENTGQGDNWNASERLGVRASYFNEISDDIDLNITLDYTNTESSPAYYQTSPTTSADAILAASVNFGLITPSHERQDTAASTAPVSKGELEQYGISGTLDWDYADDHQVKFTAGYRYQDGERNVALLNGVNVGVLQATAAGFNDNIIGANQFLGFFGSMPGTTPLAVDTTPRDDLNAQLAETASTLIGAYTTGTGNSKGPDEHEQYSLEATFTGELMNERLEYTAGLYYFNEDTATNRQLAGGYSRQDDFQHYLLALSPLGALQGLAGAMAATPTMEQYACLTPGTCSPAETGEAFNTIVTYLNDPAVRDSYTAYASALDGARNASAAPIIIDTEAMAVYASLTYHIADNLRVTGGLRISDEERTGIQQPLSPFFGDATTLMGNPIDINFATLSFDSTDPSFSMEYDVNEDMLIYASYSEAFRSGGFNQSTTSPNASGQSYGEDFVFDSEEIDAFEIGFKSDLMDRRMRVNGAVYHYELSNEQFNIPKNLLLRTAREITNTNGDFYGAEINVIALLGAKFTASFNYAYTSGELDPVVNPNLCTNVATGAEADCTGGGLGLPGGGKRQHRLITVKILSATQKIQRHLHWITSMKSPMALVCVDM